MAAAAANIVLKAPSFHGPRESGIKEGITAEDFIGQCENMMITQGWNDQVAAGHAISYLNGAARFWFFDALKAVEPVTRLAAMGSFAAFRALFVRYFFAIRSTFDLSVDWTGLKQKTDENVQTFTLRVAGTMNKYLELFPVPALDPAPVEDLRDALALIFATVHVDDRADVIAAHRAPFLNLINVLRTADKRSGFACMVDDIILKLLSEGVRDEKMRELVRRHHKLQTPLATLIPMMTDLENTGQRRKEAAAGPTPKLMAISHPPQNNGLSPEEIALVNEHRGKQPPQGGSNGRGRGGGRGGGNRGRGRGGGEPNGGRGGNSNATPATSNARNPPAPDSVYWTKICTYCNKYGHLQEVCFKKEKDGKASNGNNPVDQVDYLGGNNNGQAGNAMGWM